MIDRRWLPPLLWAGVVLTLTSIPSRHLPRGDFVAGDKLVHFFLYAVLGMLVARPLLEQTRVGAAIVATVVVCALAGALDEWHQRFVPGRSPSVVDWVADVAGATAGLSLAALRSRRDRISRSQ